MDFHTLSPLFSHAGAAEWGMCAFADLELSTDQLEKAQVLCPTTRIDSKKYNTMITFH